jgi:hypothetical protein
MHVYRRANYQKFLLASINQFLTAGVLKNGITPDGKEFIWEKTESTKVTYSAC